MNCAATHDLNRYLGSCEAADGAEESHAAAVAEWKRDTRASRTDLARVLKSYTDDYGCDHADLIVSICLGDMDPRAVESVIAAALDYAITCGEGPKYRSPEEIAAEYRAERSEARKNARNDL